MTKSRISTSIDRVLSFFVTAFLGIAVAGFFVRDTATIIMVGATSALCITALIGLRGHKKTGVDNKLIKQTMTQFYLKSDAFSFDAVLQALKSRYKTANTDGEYILVNHIAVYPYLKPKQLSVEQFCTIFKTAPEGIKRLVILTANGITNETQRFIAGLTLKPFIATTKPEQTYKLLKRLGHLPHIEFKPKPARRSIRVFAAQALSPPAARRYLMTALILIGSSFFMPASIYFLVVGSICVVLSILAALDVGGKFNA